MIFEKFKEDIVVEKGWLDKKGVRRLAVRLALLVALFALGIAMVTLTTVGALVAIAVLIMFGIIYVWVFDLADESEENLKRTIKISKLWWLGILFDVAIFIVLSYFNFL